MILSYIKSLLTPVTEQTISYIKSLLTPVTEQTMLFGLTPFEQFLYPIAPTIYQSISATVNELIAHTIDENE